MTVVTFVFVGASILVSADKGAGAPIGALVFGVLVQLGLSPEVLPVVGKDTDIPLVLGLIVGAPHCLEVEHVKV